MTSARRWWQAHRAPRPGARPVRPARWRPGSAGAGAPASHPRAHFTVAVRKSKVSSSGVIQKPLTLFRSA